MKPDAKRLHPRHTLQRSPSSLEHCARELGLVALLIGCTLSIASRAEAQLATSTKLTETSGGLEDLARLSEGKLLPGYQLAGHRFVGGLSAGWLIGLDVGADFPLAEASEGFQPDLALGIRTGYAAGNGLAVLGRFDLLGTHPLLVPATRLSLLSVGLRYEFPNLPVMPFVEGDFGLAFLASDSGADLGLLGSDLTVSGGPALGVAVPLGPYFAVTLTGRDWFTFFRSTNTQTLAVQLGFEVTLSGALFSNAWR
jgi:hypothetical protein